MIRIPTHIMIHHSLTRDSDTVSWAAIEKYHKEIMGWRDIGYHAGVEIVSDNPELFTYRYQALKGRSEYELAAACPQGNMNALALHVCVIGNFDYMAPAVAQLDCLVKRVLLDWMRRYSISSSNIVGHRDFNNEKSCPGKMFDMGLIKRMVS